MNSVIQIPIKMTKNIKVYISVIVISFAMLSCKKTAHQDAHQHDDQGNHVEQVPSATAEPITEEHHEEEFTLTQDQLDILNIEVSTISKRTMIGYIQVNGKLGVPPQNEALVSSLLGANITEIKAIEGDEVKKGQILAYISHPDIIKMQTDYLQTYNSLLFLEQDYNRKKKLYEAGVGSGSDFQRSKSTYSSAKGLTKGYESQLRLLGVSAKKVREGNIYESAPIKSPISGFIEKVLVKTGQYIQPQTPIFEIVNTEHIHVDLMIFEKDISKVKNGQEVKFNIEVLGNKEMTATIYSVGKSFEEGPKALHVHAEIENKDQNLIPGMYVNARIITESNLEEALPEDAIFQEGEKHFVFTAEKEADGTWGFSPKEVIVKSTNNGFSTFDFLEPFDRSKFVAQGGAYYLMAEMKKSEAEHSH